MSFFGLIDKKYFLDFLSCKRARKKGEFLFGPFLV
jgi:hypothetical protein